MAIQIGSLVVFALGVYLEGAMADNNEWLAKVKELEARVAIAEEKSKTENVKVEQQIVEKTRVVKEKGRDIIQYIDREVVKNNEIVKYVENCPVPKEVLDVHNQAATMNRGEKK
jgi:translation elongation factor EF-Tu-like GTPase